MSSHDGECEGGDCKCFKRKLQSVQFANVMPPPERLWDKRLEKDLPAYDRMRRQGLQPPSTKGAAELEQRANTQLEVGLGKLIDPSLLRKHGNEIAEGMAMARDSEYTLRDVKEWREKAQQT